MWTKILLLVAIWWLWRFAARTLLRRPRPKPDVRSAPGTDAARRERGRDRAEDLSRQDISDADYEEIP